MTDNTRRYGVPVIRPLLIGATMALLGELALARQQPKTAEAPRVAWTSPTLREAGSVSSDGRYLSYRDAPTGQLAIRDLQSRTDYIRFTNSTSGYPALVERSALSPDLRSVAYGWFNGANQWELRVVTAVADARPRTLLVRGRLVEAYGWTADGQAILVQVDGTPSELILVAARDGATRTLRVNSEGTATHAALSPDGRNVGFDLPVSGSAEERDVFVVGVADGKFARVVNAPGHDRFVGWGPGSNGAGRLLYATNRDGSLDLFDLPLRDQAPAGAARLLRRDIPAWIVGSTSSGALFATGVTGGPQLRMRKADFTTVRWLTTQSSESADIPGANRGPDWSRDGRFIAYLAIRERIGRFLQAFDVQEGRGSITVRSVETGQERQVEPALAAYQQPRWWPDGRALLLKGTDRTGREGVFKVDIDTGAAQLLVLSAGSGAQLPQVSPDGSRLYFWSGTGLRGSDGSVFVERHLQTGLERTFYRGSTGPLFPNLSYDGKYLVGTTYDPAARTPTVDVFDIGTLERRILLRSSVDIGQATATPDGQNVIVPAGRELIVIRVTGGEAGRLPIEGGAVGTGGVRVHPDGQRVAYWTGTEQQGVLWAIDEIATGAADAASRPAASK
jgi:Tol biopolymer transport system component